MKTLKLLIPREALLALKVISPNHSRAPVMDSIFFEICQRVTRLVTSDGDRMLAVCVNDADPRRSLEEDDERHVIVPRHLFEDVKRDRGLAVIITFEFDEEKNATQITVRCHVGKDVIAVERQAPPLKGKYPDWRNSIPKEISGEPSQLNPGYVGDFARVSRIFGNRIPSLRLLHNGEGNVLCDFGLEHVFGLIAPVRIPSTGTFPPAWVKREEKK